MVSSKGETFKPILMLQFSILILSIASIVAKSASVYPVQSFKFIALFALEIVILAVYALMWQQVLKRFDLTVAYANKGTVIIWVFLWAGLFFGESITLNNILGAVLVMIGTALVLGDA